MTMTDPIADLLTRIRNGLAASHDVVMVPHSRLKLSIVKLLKTEGFVQGYEVLETDPQYTIRIYLKYNKGNQGIIRGLQRVSKPSRRVYVRRDDVPYVRNGLGVAILTTPKGVLTDREARTAGVGGEVLCYVW